MCLAASSLLAACGGGVDASLITVATDKARAAGSAKVSTRTVVKVADDIATQVDGTGVLDFSRGRARLSSTASSPQLQRAGVTPRPCTMIHDQTLVYL